jgi:mannose-1-phosphate guanylyltransferase
MTNLSRKLEAKTAEHCVSEGYLWIDYPVMERTKNAAVMPVSYGGSDGGSWQAVCELSARDTLSN